MNFMSFMSLCQWLGLGLGSVVQVYVSTDYSIDANKDECFVRL